MMNRKIKHRITLTILSLTLLLPAAAAMAEESRYMPQVNERMCKPVYWACKEPKLGNELLAELPDLEAINQRIVDTPDCCMTDLKKVRKYYRQKAFYRSLWTSAFSDASAVTGSIHYGTDDREVSGAEVYELLGNIGLEEGADLAELHYGICVRRTNLTALPTDVVATDELGDADYNFFQLSALRVNEPVVVKAVSRDGKYYYCDADCVSGWALSEDIAICEDKEEWLEAWNIPNEEAIVVTQSRIHLEESNINPDVNGISLPMGTVLRKVKEQDYDPAVTGRQLFQNTAVWLPVRQEDGSYSQTIALISQNQTFSEGYLPLTSRNILTVAFSKLGEVYGWGSMLDSVDCSNYIRDIYKCFGLSLARNTTWQCAMPVRKYDVSSATVKEKEALLDMLPAGTVLYFKGHEMLYLGKADGSYYVISALGTVKDFDSDVILNVRSIVVNTLNIVRPNGKTWLQSLDTMLIPYLLPEVPGMGNTSAADTEAVMEAEAAPAAEAAQTPDGAEAEAAPGPEGAQMPGGAEAEAAPGPEGAQTPGGAEAEAAPGPDEVQTPGGAETEAAPGSEGAQIPGGAEAEAAPGSEGAQVPGGAEAAPDSGAAQTPGGAETETAPEAEPVQAAENAEEVSANENVVVVE